jgi:MFS family permease
MLGFVSLFMDTSSELVHSLLPIFIVSTLGASALTLGIIEGIAEALALFTRMFSGAISDWMGKRKLLTVIGYGVGAITKPLFPLAASVDLVAGARFADRLGKGIRGAPRDALLGDLAPAEIRGACFGLRQSLDTVGAFAGPLLAIALMLAFADIRTVLWFAVIPAVAAVLLLVLGVEEPRSAGHGRAGAPMRAAELKTLDRAFWVIVALGAVFTLARFSEAFLVLKAAEVGLEIAWVPLVMVVMSAAFAASAYPAGRLSDRLDRRYLLLPGLGALIAAHMVLANAASLTALFAGVALWGLHMGLTQGILATLVADCAPARLRGTAFGVFNLASGIALVAASTAAGWLWDYYGPAATFYVGAALAFAALTGLAVHTRNSGRTRRRDA